MDWDIPRRGDEQKIKDLFKDGSQGAWYDPSDLTTLYQDSAGTTPVTAVEQPVGLMLDKSKGLVLGSELVANPGPFTATTGWTPFSGATSISVSSSNLRVSIQSGTAADAYTSFATTIGTCYSVSVSFVSGSNITYAKVLIGTTGGAGQNYVTSTTTTAKTWSFVFFATATTTYLTLEIGGSAGATSDWSIVSTRLLPGHHAFHTPGDTTTRPTVSRRINLLTKTEQFDDAAWTKNQTTVTQNAIVAPDGTTTADLLLEAAATSYHAAYQQQTLQTAGQRS